MLTARALRDYRIVQMRLAGATYAEIAQEYWLTRQRVHQIVISQMGHKIVRESDTRRIAKWISSSYTALMTVPGGPHSLLDLVRHFGGRRSQCNMVSRLLSEQDRRGIQRMRHAHRRDATKQRHRLRFEELVRRLGRPPMLVEALREHVDCRCIYPGDTVKVGWSKLLASYGLSRLTTKEIYALSHTRATSNRR